MNVKFFMYQVTRNNNQLKHLCNSKIKKKKAASDEIAMAHALNICHNIQVVEDPYLQHKPNYKRGVLEYL